MSKNNPVHVAAITAVNESMRMPEKDKREYLEMLGCAAVHYMRANFGDEYTKGWLEHALSDLSRGPLVGLAKTN